VANLACDLGDTRAHRLLPGTCFFCLPRPLLQKILRIGELPHIRTAKKYASPIGKLNATYRDANARVDDGNRRRGRDWPNLVGRRDVQLGPRGRLGNELSLDIAAC
jgi:hypothetical protein